MPWIAVVTVGAFSGQMMGCGGTEEADQSQREVSAEILAPAPDDSGATALRSFGEQKLTLGEYPWMNRTLMVDGRSTTDVNAIRTATEIVVPLNDGGTVALRRTGDLYEVMGVVRNQSTDAVQLRGFRLGDGGFELFRADNLDNAAPNAAVRLKGIDDLTSTRATLAASMALQSLLATVEDGETIAPVIALALIAAALAAAWLAACFGESVFCANHCGAHRGFDVTCGLLKVQVTPPRNINVHFSLGFSCHCLN
jgi:hypothetical protein